MDDSNIILFGYIIQEIILMKKRMFLLLTAMLVVAMMIMTSCGGGGSLGMSCDSEKLMTIEAENSGEGDEVMAGGLVVAAGAQIVITSGLESGEIKIELFAAPEDPSIEEIPDIEGSEPVMTFNATDTDAQSGTVPEGDYYAKATTAEKANGTITIEVKAAE